MHVGDSIAALNDIAVEQHRQARARKAGLVTSMEQDRTEMPLRDNEAPKQAWTSGLDIQKAFHRCPLKKGLSHASRIGEVAPVEVPVFMFFLLLSSSMPFISVVS